MTFTQNYLHPLAELYRCRWQVELFFKWIKQHLRIKRFYGTSENAVKTQIWIAISVYVLVAIVKKRLRIEASLYTILQILSLTLFEKTPLDQLLKIWSYKWIRLKMITNWIYSVKSPDTTDNLSKLSVSVHANCLAQYSQSWLWRGCVRGYARASVGLPIPTCWQLGRQKALLMCY